MECLEEGSKVGKGKGSWWFGEGKVCKKREKGIRGVHKQIVPLAWPCPVPNPCSLSCLLVRLFLGEELLIVSSYVCLCVCVCLSASTCTGDHGSRCSCTTGEAGMHVPCIGL